MKTFIKIVSWGSIGILIFGLIYVIGMVIADDLYKQALGYDAYFELNAISLWNMLGIFAIGSALAIFTSILEMVFKAGESSAAQKEQEDE